MNETYKAYTDHLRKIADVEHAIAVLSWDKEVNMPTKGAALRAQQIATLSGMAHELFVSEQLGEWLNKLGDADLSFTEKRNVENTIRDYDRAQKYDQAFVIKGSRLVSAAYQAWLKSREANDYALYRSALSDLIAHKREEAELLGYADHPYDALLDLYEEDSKVADLDVLFERVKTSLLRISKAIRDQPQISADFLHLHYDKDKQWAFGLELLKIMGYDFEAGRQDISPHPFTITFNPDDVRVTTRINTNDVISMTSSCIHEGGHALYEQGLPTTQYGLPGGRAVSLGIHESQSRLWENNVGRSLGFWQKHIGLARQFFPAQLGDVSPESFYKAINRLEPNLIRTEADEVHYHFHVMIRYEIEKRIMAGEVEAADLRDLWNDMYDEYLGLRPTSDNEGILQDIHWAHGSIGYFPTYSLGSFYAAQFYRSAQSDIPDLDQKISSGDTATLLQWLREKIHVHGKSYKAKDLCTRITGEPLNFSYFEDYVKEKFGGIYNVDLS